MKQELEQKLINKHPWIFDMGGNIKNNGLMFGIQCDDGWYWLIDQLCSQIQKYIDDNELPQVVASQIKEKYGNVIQEKFLFINEFGIVEIIVFIIFKSIKLLPKHRHKFY